MQWYLELQEREGEEEDVIGEADPDEDDGDFSTKSDHDSESEQEGEDPKEEENLEWFCDGDIPCYIGKDRSTQWKKICPPITRTKVHNFFTKKPGPINNASKAKTELECFQIFMSDNIIEIITNSTNIYINKMKTKYQRDRDAKLTDTCEVRALFGMLYLLGVSRSGRQNIMDLWRTDGTGMDAIYCTFSYNRFRFLLRCLRFDDIRSREERRQSDKLAAIREVFQLFLENCQKSVVPGPNLTIDEQLVAFRGRCPFRQYIPSKPAKYGIKIFALVDTSTMYTLNLEVYAGSQPEGPFQLSNSPGEVVKRLVQVVKGTYRNITMDNWFTSFPLALELKNDCKLTMLGTLKKNKREIPPELVNTAERKEKSSQFAFHQDCILVSYVPKKKKNVLVLSTTHSDDGIDNETGKPMMVIDYNQTKYGVDVVDQMCSTYNVARNSRRWPLTIFFDIMNIAGINALVLHELNNPNSSISRNNFLHTLGLDLLRPQIVKRSHLQNIPRKLKEKCRMIVHTEEPSTSEEVQEAKRTKTGNGRCYLCPRKKDKRTRNYCSACNKWICMEHKKEQPSLCVKCDEENQNS